MTNVFESMRLYSSRLVRAAAVVVLLSLSLPAAAQQEIGVDIYQGQAAGTIRIAIPFPDMGPRIVPDQIHRPFFTPLTGDLAYSEIFTIVPLPPSTPPSIETAQKSGAQAFLKLSVTRDGSDYVIEARLYDVNSRTIHMGRRYRGNDAALTRIAHTIANDLVLFFNGRPGVFLSQIVFVSGRSGSKELYLMDYDGSNQRRVTFHNSLTLTPDWSPDGDRIVYTSFSRGTSDLYLMHRQGGGRVRLETGVGLNVSPAFSPDGKTIAFVGSVDGNPDIYVINVDGSSLRRLTTASSIESTPAWSPTGRQIAFTSSRSGSPQIYLMDAEGTNVRRISFDGNWNDDAVFSPDGELLAYTSLVSGRYQIRIANIATGESRIIAGLGSNEQPSWSPDGRAIIFQSNRSGRWQIYRVGVDGSNLIPLATEGENTSPTWSGPS